MWDHIKVSGRANIVLGLVNLLLAVLKYSSINLAAGLLGLAVGIFLTWTTRQRR